MTEWVKADRITLVVGVLHGFSFQSSLSDHELNEQYNVRWKVLATAHLTLIVPLFQVCPHRVIRLDRARVCVFVCVLGMCVKTDWGRNSLQIFLLCVLMESLLLYYLCDHRFILIRVGGRPIHLSTGQVPVYHTDEWMNESLKRLKYH